jgi:hypothetical protein
MPRLFRLLGLPVIALSWLAGCAELPPDVPPGYSYVPVASLTRPGRVDYVLAPDACLTPDPTDFQLGPRLPPGCANAANLEAMVERKRDLVHGRRLGPAPAAPSARAAQHYIYGTRRYLGAGVPPATATNAPGASSTEPEPATVSPSH